MRRGKQSAPDYGMFAPARSAAMKKMNGFSLICFSLLVYYLSPSPTPSGARWNTSPVHSPYNLNEQTKFII